MPKYILTDGQVKRYWIIDIVDPADLKIASGEMNLRVNVGPFKRSFEAARAEVIEQNISAKK